MLCNSAICRVSGKSHRNRVMLRIEVDGLVNPAVNNIAADDSRIRNLWEITCSMKTPTLFLIIRFDHCQDMQTSSIPFRCALLAI